MKRFCERGIGSYRYIRSLGGRSGCSACHLFSANFLFHLFRPKGKPQSWARIAVRLQAELTSTTDGKEADQGGLVVWVGRLRGSFMDWGFLGRVGLKVLGRCLFWLEHVRQGLAFPRYDAFCRPSPKLPDPTHLHDPGPKQHSN